MAALAMKSRSHTDRAGSVPGLNLGVFISRFCREITYFIMKVSLSLLLAVFPAGGAIGVSATSSSSWLSSYLFRQRLCIPPETRRLTRHLSLSAVADNMAKEVRLKFKANLSTAPLPNALFAMLSS